LKFENTLCNGGATGTSYTTGDTLANCAANCANMATCNQFWFSGTAGAGSCKIFTPADTDCTFTYSAGAGTVY
jgi:hypothetical protein